MNTLWQRPPGATATLVLAHGAGAGMTHSFMESLAAALAQERVATLRYNFPYLDAGSGRPDSPAVAHAAVRAAVDLALERAPDLPLFAGGKSFGGRMTSQAQAARPLPSVRGLVFVAFPLHPAGAPADARATHLQQVTLPMLFLQGDHDKLADLTLLRPVCDSLGARAELEVIAGADHSFHVPRKSGRTDAEVIATLAARIANFATVHSRRHI